MLIERTGFRQVSGFGRALRAALAVGTIFFANPESILSQTLIRLEGLHGNVRGLNEQAQAIWAATDKGLFYTRDGFAFTRVTGSTSIEVHCIKDVFGNAWLGTSRGVFQLDALAASYRRINLLEIDDNNIFFIVPDSETSRVWVGTDRGVYVINLRESTPQAYRVLPERILFLGTVNRQLIASTPENIYKWDSTSDTFKELYSVPVSGVVDVVAADNGIYLRANDFGTSLYRFPGKPRPLLSGVLSIGSVENSVWLSIEGQVFSLDEEKGLGLISGQYMSDIRIIKETTNYDWLVSNDHVFRRTHGEQVFRLLAIKKDAFNIAGIAETSKGVWLWGRSGVYRVFDDVRIDAEIGSIRIEDIEVVIGRNIKVNRVAYDIDSKDPFPPVVDRDFAVLIQSDERSFEEKRYDPIYYAPQRFVRHSPFPGDIIYFSFFGDIYIGILDSYGNLGQVKGFLSYRPRRR